jgi:hypothetical protein
MNILLEIFFIFYVVLIDGVFVYFTVTHNVLVFVKRDVWSTCSGDTSREVYSTRVVGFLASGIKCTNDTFKLRSHEILIQIFYE